MQSDKKKKGIILVTNSRNPKSKDKASDLKAEKVENVKNAESVENAESVAPSPEEAKTTKSENVNFDDDIAQENTEKSSEPIVGNAVEKDESGDYASKDTEKADENLGDSPNGQAQALVEQQACESDDGEGRLKDEKIDASKVLDETAQIFGFSKEKLACEFGAYKAQKLFKRMNLFLADHTICDEDVKVRVKAGANMGFESVTVLPNKLKVAVSSANKQIGVRVAINYPCAGLYSRTILKTIGWAVRQKASAIELYFMPSDIKDKKVRQIIAKWRAYKKKAGKVNLILCVESCYLSQHDLNLLSRVVKGATVENVKVFIDPQENLITDNLYAHTWYDLTKTFNGCRLEGGFLRGDTAKITTAFKCGVNNISAKNGIELSVKIKRYLGCQ